MVWDGYQDTILLDKGTQTVEIVQRWFQDSQYWDPVMVSFPSYSYIFRDSHGSGIGIVWVRGPILGGHWKSHWILLPSPLLTFLAWYCLDISAKFGYSNSWEVKKQPWSLRITWDVSESLEKSNSQSMIMVCKMCFCLGFVFGIWFELSLWDLSFWYSIIIFHHGRIHFESGLTGLCPLATKMTFDNMFLFDFRWEPYIYESQWRLLYTQKPAKRFLIQYEWSLKLCDVVLFNHFKEQGWTQFPFTFNPKLFCPFVYLKNLVLVWLLAATAHQRLWQVGGLGFSAKKGWFGIFGPEADHDKWSDMAWGPYLEDHPN